MRLKTLSLITLLFSLFQMAAQAPSFTAAPTLLNPSVHGPINDCIIDMNGDYLDDVVRVGNNGFTIDYQMPDGTFNQEIFPILIGNIPNWSIAAGDITGNGYNDLLLGSTVGVSILRANNDGTNYLIENKPEYIFSQRSTFADIDNDGNLDAFVCHDVDQSHPYRNDGQGNLILDQTLIETADLTGNYAAVWVDYDNDEDIDLYITKCKLGSTPGDIERTNLLYRNNGNGTFEEVGAIANLDDNAQSWATVFEDFDNDGDFDAFIVNHDFQNRFMRNNGDGTFTDIIATTNIFPQDLGAWENSAGDFNNDGYIDIYSELQRELYLNNGNLTFTGIDLPINGGAIGDLNDDGFLDLMRGSQVYLNDGNNNNWIKINTLGTISNRNGIGARVEIYGVWGRQIREVRSGESFSPMHSLTTHFGIGFANEIDSLVIKWPSGEKTVEIQPEINTTHLIIEPCRASIPEALTISDSLICPNQTANIQAPLGYTYQWSTGETTSSIEVSTAAEYFVSITDDNGCEAVKSATLNISPEPSGMIEFVGGSENICADETAILMASGGVAYQWNNDAMAATISVNETDNYIVTITDDNQCTTTAAQTINVNPLPLVDIETTNGQDSFCADITVELTGTGGQAYEWNTGATNPTILASNSNLYQVTVTDDNGCKNIATKTIEILPIPIAAIQIVAGDDNICQGDSSTLVGQGGITYQWNTSANTEQIIATLADNYVVTVTDEQGCTATAAQEIVVNENPVASIQLPNDQSEYCNGDTIEVTANGGMTYEWNTTASSQNIFVTETGEYTVTVTDENGCTNSINQSITVHALPRASIIVEGDNTSFCAGEFSNLLATGGNAYHWNTEDTSNEIMVSASGAYEVTVTDENNCTAMATQFIEVFPLPNVTIDIQSGDENICEGETAVLTVTGGEVYSWNNSIADSVLTVTTTDTYIVTATDGNGCSASATQPIEVSPLPNAEIVLISGDTSICDGNTAILEATGGLEYNWNNSTTDSVLMATTSDTYLVTVTDENGCTATAQQLIEVLPLPLAQIEIISGNTSICEGNVTLLEASGGSAYLWSNGVNTATLSTTASADYSVTVTDEQGCSAVETQNITVFPAPVALINPTGGTSFCEGDTTMLLGSGGITYEWSNGVINSSVTLYATGDYSLTITDANGCQDTAYQSINFNPLPIATIETMPSDSLFCEGDSIQIMASGVSQYLWNTGENSAIISVDSTGIYSVMLTDSLGCSNMASQFIEFSPNPEIPIIVNYSIAGDTYLAIEQALLSSGYDYQWFYQDSILENSNLPEILCPDNGIYQVMIIDSNGCTAISEALEASGCLTNTTAIDFVRKINIYPNPTTDYLHLHLDFTDYVNSVEMEVYNQLGMLIQRQTFPQVGQEWKTKLAVDELVSGLYYLSLKIGDAYQIVKFVKE